MLNPKSKKKAGRTKRRLEDVLGAEQRYEPLEITLDDGSLSSAHSSSHGRSWKGAAFFVSTILLLPLLVYYIFDKSGLVIVIDKRAPTEAPTFSLQQEEEDKPIITGVAEPKYDATSESSKEPPSSNNHASVDEKVKGEESLAKKKSVVKQAKNDESPPPIPDTHNDQQAPPKNPIATIPSLIHADRMDCADNLNMKYDEIFQKFHQPGALFCRESSVISECHCESTVDPAPQSPTKVPTEVWQAAFEKNTELAMSAPINLDVVLLGDSVTEHLAGTELGEPEETWEKHSAVFNKLFTREGGGDISGMALGIGGDGCAQLLYRLQNGELPPNFYPQVWWVLIGTNDLSDNCSAEATLMGIIAVVEEIRLQRPSATIVINSILPRPRNSMGTLTGILWIKSVWINQRLECYASSLSNVEYFDASDIFLNLDHSKAIKNHYAKDWIHPSAFGTQKWGEAIVEKVKDIINLNN